MAMAFTFLPSYLLSGFVFSIDSMPALARAATYLVPARYFVKAIKGIWLKGVGLGTLAAEAAMLLLFAAATVLAATRIFRKKLR
jgi:ABC-2 type transport system permease protein